MWWVGEMAEITVTFHNFADMPKNVTAVVNFKDYDMKKKYITLNRYPHWQKFVNNF
jgi:hypothetical protein